MSRDMSHGWYVYAVVRAGAALPGALVGLDDAPITLVPSEPLAAVVSPVADANAVPTVTSAHLLQHERAVEAVCRLAPALPVRFGTVFPDRQALARALQARRAALQADLARIGGKVEMGLSALWRAPGPGPGDPALASDQNASPSRGDALPPALRAATRPGARYLAARFSRYAARHQAGAAAKSLAERIGSTVRPHVIESRCDVNPTPRLALRAAYLLEPDAVEDFKAACAELRGALPDLRFLVTGPWPPYSFVSRSDRQTPASVPDSQLPNSQLPDSQLPTGLRDGDRRPFPAHTAL